MSDWSEEIRKMNKVKYTIDKNENEFKQIEFLNKVHQTVGNHVHITGRNIEVEVTNEIKIVRILIDSGLKYQKAS